MRSDKSSRDKFAASASRRKTAYGIKMNSQCGMATEEERSRNRDYFHRPAYADTCPMRKNYESTKVRS